MRPEDLMLRAVAAGAAAGLVALLSYIMVLRGDVREVLAPGWDGTKFARMAGLVALFALGLVTTAVYWFEGFSIGQILASGVYSLDGWAASMVLGEILLAVRLWHARLIIRRLA